MLELEELMLVEELEELTLLELELELILDDELDELTLLELELLSPVNRVIL